MAWQHEVRDLPAETLLFLLPSRFCESDLLASEAWRLFGHTPLGIRACRRCAISSTTTSSSTTATRGRRAPPRKPIASRAASAATSRILPSPSAGTQHPDALLHRLHQRYRHAEAVGEHGFLRLDGSLSRRPLARFRSRNNAPRIGRILIASGRDARRAADPYFRAGYACGLQGMDRRDRRIEGVSACKPSAI